MSEFGAKSELVERVVASCEEISLKHKVYKVCGDYYEKTLEERREILKAPSIHHLCKTLLFENNKFKADEMLLKHSKYCLVLIQYTDRLLTKKLNQIMRSFAPGQSSKVFNMRIAKEQAADELVGFPSGGHTPLGTLAKLPIIMSEKISNLDVMFLGCGEIDHKISFSPQEFVEKMDNVTVADISDKVFERHDLYEMNFSDGVDLNKIRAELIRLEDTIIFGFIERSQFAVNPKVYNVGGVEGLSTSFLDYFIHEIESVHSKVRRYTSPDEYPFSKNLPAPVLPALDFPKILHENSVNVNDEILETYISKIVPSICKEGSDGNIGSSATKDVDCLQALSRRIHFGKFVAEAKFVDPKYHDKYVELIKANDEDGIMNLLTNTAVERKLLRRLRKKVLIYGQEIDDSGENEDGDGGNYVAQQPRISPTLMAAIYEQFVIPLTKKVEVEYLLQRLN